MGLAISQPAALSPTAPDAEIKHELPVRSEGWAGRCGPLALGIDDGYFGAAQANLLMAARDGSD